MESENKYIETDLGNVAPNPRGEYSETAAYEYLDLVEYGGGSYLCIRETGTITGIAPVQNKNTETWQVLTIPGDLTPEYVAMHDDVVNKAESAKADAASTAADREQVEAMLANVEQLHSDTETAAQEASDSRDSAAGYAAAAEASRAAAAESEKNAQLQVTGFDETVSAAKQEATGEIATARKAAVQAVAAQQVQSVNAVNAAGNAAIEKTSADAEEAKDAKAEAVSAANAAEGSAGEAKTAAGQAKNDRQSAEAAATAAKSSAEAAETAQKAVEGAAEQIEENAAGIKALKEDIDNTNEQGTYLVNEKTAWEQGNFSYSDGKFLYSDNPGIIRSTFVDVSKFNLAYPLYIYVPDAFQIAVWALDKNDGSYTVIKAAAIWTSGMIKISGLTGDINYFICKVRTAPDGKGLITPSDAKNIKFYGSSETKAYNTAKEAGISAKGAMNVANEGLSLTTRQLSIKNLPKKNLLNINNAVHGYYLNNKFNATDTNNTWMAAIIDANQYKTITLSGFPDKGGAYTAFLHGNSIEKWSMNAWNTKDNNGTHIIPDKYRFIGVCWNAQTGENELQIEYGDTATDFESYELVKKSETIEYLNLHMSGNDEYIGKYLKSVKAQPMYFAIIDDDTNTQKSVKKFYDICVANNVVGGFAVEARHLELDESIVTMLRNYENEGFGCYLHCYNQAAQTPGGINCWDTGNRTNIECLKYAEQDFNKGLRMLNSWGFLDAQSVWVVPGGVPDTDASRNWIMSMAQKRGFRYAINADPKKYITEEPNTLNNRYNVPRFGLTNQVNDGNTEKLKSYIDNCVSIGASMILMTHTGMWEDGDEEALTTRFGEVVQYAKLKGLINVNPLELLEKKYPLYMYNEMR